jgi:hypothetical protein
MIKRLTVAVAALSLLASTAFGAGTLPGFSLSQQMGKDGKPLAGCILKFYQAGTVATPQTAYQDSGLTIPIAGGTCRPLAIPTDVLVSSSSPMVQSKSS